jgi:hypothetical protein
MSYLGWRWTQYLTCIMAVFFGALGLLIVPETYGPILLQRRAKKKRLASKNMAYHADLDKVQISPRDLLLKYLYRPFEMLIKEPILLCSKFKSAFLYFDLQCLAGCVHSERHALQIRPPKKSTDALIVFQTDSLSYIIYVLYLWSYISLV